jgi:hypothetical protein
MAVRNGRNDMTRGSTSQHGCGRADRRPGGAIASALAVGITILGLFLLAAGALAGEPAVSAAEQVAVTDAPAIVTAAEDETGPGSVLAAELMLFGHEAAGSWRAESISGDLGAAGGQGGVSGLGRRAKAGFFSLLVPGAGQWYNGERTKALVFAGVEAAVWASYLTFDVMGDNRSDTYQEYASIYAGTNGDHPDGYWQSVGRYLDSDAYNEAQRREARATGDEPRNLVGSADGWQWRNEDRLQAYQDLRADATRAYDRRDFMILFAIVNRAVAVFDAVRNSVDDRLSTRVLGFDLALEVSPSLHHPRAEWTIKRSF